MTSPAYGAGHTEEVVGRAVAEDREHWVVGLLGGVSVANGRAHRDFSAKGVVDGLEASLARLATADVDVFMLQGPTAKELGTGECLEALERVRRTGRAGFVGIDMSGSPSDVELPIGASLDILGFRYNVFEPEAGDWFASARELGVGVVAEGVLADGFLAGKFDGPGDFEADDERSLMEARRIGELIRKAGTLKFLESRRRTLAQAALLYVLANRGTSVALTGAATVAQLEEDAAAGSMEPLHEETLDHINRLQRSAFRA